VFTFLLWCICLCCAGRWRCSPDHLSICLDCAFAFPAGRNCRSRVLELVWAVVTLLPFVECAVSRLNTRPLFFACWIGSGSV